MFNRQFTLWFAILFAVTQVAGPAYASVPPPAEEYLAGEMDAPERSVEDETAATEVEQAHAATSLGFLSRSNTLSPSNDADEGDVTITMAETAAYVASLDSEDFQQVVGSYKEYLLQTVSGLRVETEVHLERMSVVLQKKMGVSAAAVAVHESESGAGDPIESVQASQDETVPAAETEDTEPVEAEQAEPEAAADAEPVEEQEAEEEAEAEESIEETAEETVTPEMEVQDTGAIEEETPEVIEEPAEEPEEVETPEEETAAAEALPKVEAGEVETEAPVMTMTTAEQERVARRERVAVLVSQILDYFFGGASRRVEETLDDFQPEEDAPAEVKDARRFLEGLMQSFILFVEENYRKEVSVYAVRQAQMRRIAKDREPVRRDGEKETVERASEARDAVMKLLQATPLDLAALLRTLDKNSDGPALPADEGSSVTVELDPQFVEDYQAYFTSSEVHPYLSLIRKMLIPEDRVESLFAKTQLFRKISEFMRSKQREQMEDKKGVAYLIRVNGEESPFIPRSLLVTGGVVEISVITMAPTMTGERSNAGRVSGATAGGPLA